MNHQSLYRRYRPETFKDVIGQVPVTRTLINQIKTGRINHAYLFTGTRGTGKTSCAKIFARAVNCLNPSDGSPCNQCSVCLELRGNNMDVLEIDAASNNGVDEIRDIREKIKFMPVTGKYKVYIIDEVHMLSINAFNALLKTLEEPPEHAIFILATTEVHKLPKTILSRCIRFDFRLIPEEDIAGLIQKVYGEIGKDAEYEAVRLIASSGEGSVRDALSIAEMCASYTTGRLTYFDVLEVIGGSDTLSIINLLSEALSGNIAGVLRGLKKMSEKGVNYTVLSHDIAAMLKNLAVIKTCPDYRKILTLPESVTVSLEKIEKSADLGQIINLMDSISGIDDSMRYATNPGIILESAIIKSIYQSVTAQNIQKRLDALEDAVKNGVQQDTGIRKNAKEIWGLIVHELRTGKTNMALYSACSMITDVKIEDNELRAAVSGGNYGLLSREDNTAVINNILKKIQRGIKFAPYETVEETDTRREDIEKIKEKLGDTEIIIK